jgi:MATE family multidrug resistance protein
VLEMMLYMTIGFVDVAMVGRLGPGPLAAVSLGAEIFFSLLMILAALGMGATVLAAQAAGAGQSQRVNHIAGQTLLLAVSLGLLAGIPCYVNIPLITGLFPVEPDVYQMALNYLQVTMLITPFALCLYMGNGVFRGIGRTRVPLGMALISNLVNIIGDYVLIFGKWGFPALGAQGAAVATTAAHLTGFLVLIIVMVCGRYGIKIRVRDVFVPHLYTIKSILNLGLPTAVEDLLRGGSNLISTYFLTSLGTIAFAAHQISLTVESVSYMPGYGFAIAATSLVGQSIGARNTKEAWASAWGGLAFAAVIMGTASIIFFTLPGYVAFLFTNDRELVSVASLCIRIAALSQLPIAFEMVLAGALRGAGDTRTPMIVSVIGIWLIRIPGIWLIIDVWKLGLIAIWWLFVVDWVFRSLVVLVMFLRGRWAVREPVL